MITYKFTAAAWLLDKAHEDFTTNGVEAHVHTELVYNTLLVTPNNADAAGYVSHVVGKFVAYGGTVVVERTGHKAPPSWERPGDVWISE